MKKYIAALLLMALSVEALAQSNPGWVPGFVPSAAQWNAEWSVKQDELGYVPLNPANNLSDVSNATTSRTNLGLPAQAFSTSSILLQAANNLSDVANATSSRSNISSAASGANSDITSLLGLTTPLSIAQGGTNATSTTTAVSNLGVLAKANNLSDVNSTSTADANLGVPTLIGSNSFSGGTNAFGSTTTFTTVNVFVTNSLVADVNLNSTSTFFDGPSVAQGTVGKWSGTGSVTVIDSAGAASISCKLWDGTTVMASGVFTTNQANFPAVIALSGAMTSSPAGNIRITCKDSTSTSGKIRANLSGVGNSDSTVTAIRLQ
jgi:hypothetical protein